MTDASRYLIELATAIATAHKHHPDIRAAMISGSAAKGIADNYSDIDMMLYYEHALPQEDWLADVRAALGCNDRKWLVDNRDEGSVMEAYPVNGIEVQIVHATFAATDAVFEEVQTNLNAETPLQKALEGMLASHPIFGAEHIERWKGRARAYPAELGDAMVRRYLNFFPLWGLADGLARRDASLWMHATLVESAQNILGVLAGLNRLYFTTFQLKHMRMVIDAMPYKPANLADRLEQLLRGDTEALNDLEALADEVITLVRQHMPHIDTDAASKRIGWRQTPWELPG